MLQTQVLLIHAERWQKFELSPRLTPNLIPNLCLTQAFLQTDLAWGKLELVSGLRSILEYQRSSGKQFDWENAQRLEAPKAISNLV